MDLRPNTIMESLGIYLPPEARTTGEVLKGCRNEVRFPLEKATGIRTRRVAGVSEFSIDLARKAVTDCLSYSRHSAAGIDVLICCNISRYDAPGSISFEPSTAAKLRAEFGFANALVFDITNACAGMFTGIYIVDAMIRSGAVRRGMVVSGEYITHLTQTAQRELSGFMDARLACLTLGDAGAAVVLEQGSVPGTGFVDLQLQTFGKYSPYCVAKAATTSGMIMYTDALRLTDVGIRSGAKHALDALQRAAWAPESFQHLVMHQTSTMTMNSARNEINRKLNSPVCHDGNTINNLEDRGNTASTAHLIALGDQVRQGRINTGDRIVFSVTASGLTTGTGLYVLDDLPDRLRALPAIKSPATIGQASAIPAAKFTTSAFIRCESIGILPIQPALSGHSMEMLVTAANDCLARSRYDANAIGLLLYAGVYRDEYLLEPAYASLLAGELDMNATAPAADHRQTLAFDIFNGAVGWLNACLVAQQMITAGNTATAMIVAAETDNNARMAESDALEIRETASAIILEADPAGRQGFSDFHFYYPAGTTEAYTSCYRSEEARPLLCTEKSEALESIYINGITIAVKELLESSGLELNQITRLFPPQLSTAFIENVSKALAVPVEKMIDVAGDGPDLFTSSVPYAIKYALDNQQVKPGDIGLIITVGSGIQIGCAIYHF
ncbi:3-oxoacyl-[acyl-carrier-protein] synthase III C-terminal domain-containing protein [Flavihumibacter petaseus]|uniref:Putative 3-oxoacyl-[acyl-carrier-protein] synthase III n=1 Tax=Flavihumibacter petaseus NBRC 106054 TaxID=1220578 RepID=A0A0E9MVE1_9BACT|nr:3-oxoacyl-[acyl-carrier-protein] synthase III C-terminal domain-containing protein [Flavihumibacter petaseus]GAO41448.1 putative 3-oxoacyl-[acyl-carrier-protein] synthase III [Flavihumibacter petaseus NBRC 106054]